MNNFTKNPKLGVFEVTCKGYLLYSKINTGTFPQCTYVANIILKFSDDY